MDAGSGFGKKDGRDSGKGGVKCIEPPLTSNELWDTFAEQLQSQQGAKRKLEVIVDQCAIPAV